MLYSLLCNFAVNALSASQPHLRVVYRCHRDTQEVEQGGRLERVGNNCKTVS